MAMVRPAVVLACILAGCPGAEDNSRPSSTAGSSHGSASSDSSATEGPGTETGASGGTSSSGGGGGSSGGVDTTGPAPDVGPVCDPTNPDMEVPPGPGDAEGGPCCTDRESCTGQDVKGMPAQTYHVGSGLLCVDGTWQIDDTSCIETCEKNGNVYLGCFWDSEYGLYSPLCGCQKP